MTDNKGEWQPEDSLAQDLNISHSSPTEKQTFAELNEGNVSIKEKEKEEEEEIEEEESGEVEVLIKSGKTEVSNGYPERKLSPRKNAFFFSKYVSYFWMTSLFVKGSKHALEQNDLEGICPEDCLHPLTESIERNWYREAYDDNGKMKKQPSLGKVIFNTFGMSYLLMGIFPVVAEVLRLVQPIFMGLVIQYFAPGSQTTRSEAYWYAFGMVACFFGQSWMLIPFTYLRTSFGAKCRIAITGLIYRKILGLSHKAIARSTTGFIVNLVSNDVTKFEMASFFIHYLWIGPIEIIIVTVLLYRELGPSCFAGVGALLLLTPLQMFMGRLIMHFRRKILKHTDERIKIMNEIISGMKVIKLYTWEESFSEWIRDLRQKEVKAIRNLAWTRAGVMSFFFSAGSFVSFVTFMTYVLAGNLLTARKVFTSFGLFNVARIMFTLYFPIGITFFNEGRVAVERIAKLLVEEDMDPEHLSGKVLRPKPDQCGVSGRDITAAWTEDSSTLKGINLNVKAGELLAIVGPVGSGKSSLLMAILGELSLSNGNIDVKGKIGYASQEPWIFNGTLKYNITFGHDFNEEKYKEVLKACALEKDIELLANGDQTLVGERGVSLSGGQKARVNLARAVYSDADIYIMDDPLSAVDANVGRHLYDKCINGYLADKPKILVTHQLQYLTDADTIIALSDGKCIGTGTHQELIEMGIDFMVLMEKDEEEEVIDDDVEFLSPEETQARRFSRQQTCLAVSLNPTTAIRKRGGSFLRQQSQASYKSHSSFMESSCAIAKDIAETTIFEEDQEVVIPKETKQGGKIGSEIFLRFFKEGYGYVVWALLFLLFAVCQAIRVFGDWWLSYWSNGEELSHGDYEYRNRDLGIYALLVILLISLGLIRALLFFQVILKSTQSMHMVMFNALMRAPVYFFDTNSIGRILNRFSKDTSLVDDMLSFSFFDLCQTSLVVIGIFVLVSFNLALVLVLVIPIIVVFIMLRVYYIKTAREVKRIESVARSPIYGHLSTTLLGLPSIRAYRVQEKFFDVFADVHDTHTEAFTTFIGCSCWLMFCLDLLCGLFITACCFMVVVFSDQLNAGVVGLMLAYAISIPGVFQQCVRQSTEVENQFTSVERILEYCDLEPEAPPKTDVEPPEDWPKRGSVVFDKLNFTYHTTLPNVLHCVSAHIKSMEKIGVCGRTGAGKSSLLSTLFRTAEPSGVISIDGVDITQLGLKDLRTKISIIPQEPVLFSGTMRKNIDPFNNYMDKELWDVLEEVQLKDAVLDLPGKLESEMAESGGNLSVGQRQLVCLARAILKRNRILVIDEATANVDPKTDELIQETIREKFKECTVLTIAHRLHTIMDSDRIMVLDAGNLKEFREPFILLRCKNSILYNLVAQTGAEEAQKLFDMARKSYLHRNKTANTERSLMGDCGEDCKCDKNDPGIAVSVQIVETSEGSNTSI